MRLSLTARVDRLLRPIHRWIWSEGDGGRDIIRAAAMTPDPLLRRLYLAHAIDELHHSDLFRDRGAALLQAHHARLVGPAATVSTICASRTSRTRSCWRSCTLRKSPPPAGSRSTARSWTTTRRRERS